MDVVLGVSMEPSTTQLVLVEGENADGDTVDRDDLAIGAEPDHSQASDRVVAAILGTRESAQEAGYRLTSTGVAFSDEAQGAMLHDALARHKVENVMLVSPLLAAAALAQAFGSVSGYGYTALMLVEPKTTTLAVVDTADGAISGIRQQPVPPEGAVAALADAVSGLQALDTQPDGLVVIGSGVDVSDITRELAATTPLPVSASEEPRLALARGAALASAHAPLFSSSTAALAYAQDPGTGAARPSVLAGYGDYPAAGGEPGLAYSAVPPTGEVPIANSAALDLGTDTMRQQFRRPAWAGGAVAIFVAGLVALVVAVLLVLVMRPDPGQRSNPGGNVAPSQQAPPPPPAAPAPANSAPAPAPANPAPARPAPAPPPANPAPAPPPAVPAPPPPMVPIPVPKIPGPGIPGPKFPKGPKGPKIPGLPGIPGIPGL